MNEFDQLTKVEHLASITYIAADAEIKLDKLVTNGTPEDHLKKQRFVIKTLRDIEFWLERLWGCLRSERTYRIRLEKENTKLKQENQKLRADFEDLKKTIYETNE